MLKFNVGFDIEFKLLELEIVLEEFLIELFKGEERDISPIEEDSLNLFNN